MEAKLYHSLNKLLIAGGIVLGFFSDIAAKPDTIQITINRLTRCACPIAIGAQSYRRVCPVRYVALQV